ncbi:fimbrial assembly chaperone [Klebsiella aerogenes]|uniref:fimbrial assembly chaperone n=1 Tax=Klebsiella aerogenes TaxID=548 RepID=UPI001868A1C3|nr:fimbrial assembly chaperone [Klebsiella aerogenes]
MRNYRLWLVFSRVLTVGFFMTAICSQVYAVVNADRTRVIFGAGETTQTLNLSNDGEAPAMVQVWTDAGDPLKTPDHVSTPVVVTPPVFRMLPHEIRSLRLRLIAQKALPENRESVFWLNIFQIQPENEQTVAQSQKLVLPLRLRMKVFIRPEGIGAPDEQQFQKLRFYAGENHLMIHNPTPWYISLNVQVPGQIARDNLMLSPMTEQRVLLASPAAPGQRIAYRVITDDGNFRDFQTILQ